MSPREFVESGTKQCGITDIAIGVDSGLWIYLY